MFRRVGQKGLRMIPGRAARDFGVQRTFAYRRHGNVTRVVFVQDSGGGPVGVSSIRQQYTLCEGV